MSDTLKSEAEALVALGGSLRNQDMPELVRENIRRHHENLVHLADDLRNLGMDQAQIDEHVVAIFEEYQRELQANINRIKAANSNQQSEQTD